LPDETSCCSTAALGNLPPSRPAQRTEPPIVIDPRPLVRYLAPALYAIHGTPGTTDGFRGSGLELRHRRLAAGLHRRSGRSRARRDAFRRATIAATTIGGKALGPPASRPLTRNYSWGGRETNRVGTHEFVDFCRRVKAEPFYCVNFLSDGDKRYSTMREGNRTGRRQRGRRLGLLCQRPGQRRAQAQRFRAAIEPQAVAIGK